jgi:hypothetical protein
MPVATGRFLDLYDQAGCSAPNPIAVMAFAVFGEGESGLEAAAPFSAKVPE